MLPIVSLSNSISTGIKSGEAFCNNGPRQK